MSDIIVAPFSNSDIRDWPSGHYAALAGILSARWPGPGMIRVIGTRNQALRANDIVRLLDPARVANDCGRLPWSDVVARLKSAACVIGNNSGIAHLAGRYGVPTVCVFGGSHQRLEWRPMGLNVVTISRSIGCSPCHLDHGANCPYDKSCLRQIMPDIVADIVLELLARPAGDAAVALRA